MQNPQSAYTQKVGGENNSNLLGNQNADKGTINMGPQQFSALPKEAKNRPPTTNENGIPVSSFIFKLEVGWWVPRDEKVLSPSTQC